MSYILEALKKAQAERQIGSTPTIHAASLASAPGMQGRGVRRAPVIVAMVLMVAAIAGLATMLVRQQPAASQPNAAAPAIVAQPPVPAAATPAAPTPAIAGRQPAHVAAAPADLPSPASVAAAPAASVATAAAPSDATSRAPAPRLAAQKASHLEARTNDVLPASPQAVPAPASPPEEPIQTLQELPEPIQRAIPPITLGGYMYSRNPADRLLLIDKVLRREGEEVAPGLLLEKLQPKQAVFSFRGYRYRVPL